MQAAIGRIQLGKLTETVSKRRRNAAVFQDHLRGLSVVSIPEVPQDLEHSYYRFHVYVNEDQLRDGWSRDRIIGEIGAAGGACFSGTCCEVYLEKAFKVSGYRPAERLPVAQRLTKQSLMFPVYSTLGLEDVERMADIAKEIIQQAQK